MEPLRLNPLAIGADSMKTEARRSKRLARWIIAPLGPGQILAIALLADSVAAQPATFSPLGNLPGNSQSWATGVSADGTVVVGFSTTSSGGEHCATPWGQLHLS